MMVAIWNAPVSLWSVFSLDRREKVLLSYLNGSNPALKSCKDVKQQYWEAIP